jgi:hypothetical protein
MYNFYLTVIGIPISNHINQIRKAAMFNSKIVDICATLPQAHMYMEFD